MKHVILFFLLLHSLLAGDQIKTLIISGQNNHNWKVTTPEIVQILEDTGKFKVEVTEKIEAFPVEQLDSFDVIVSNWNLVKFKKGVPAHLEWSEELKEAYVDFVKNGKGHVALHAGSSTFYDWKEYQEIGIATWVKGTTHHGKQHEFEVRIEDVEHPVTKGLKNFTKHDELWESIHVADTNAQVLTSSFSSKKFKGDDAWEKSTLVSEYGKGRTAYTSLGHDKKALQSPELRVLIARLIEWAATGDVSQ